MEVSCQLTINLLLFLICNVFGEGAKETLGRPKVQRKAPSRFVDGFGSEARGKLFLKRFKEMLEDEVFRPLIEVNESAIIIYKKREQLYVFNRMYWWDENYKESVEARTTKFSCSIQFEALVQLEKNSSDFEAQSFSQLLANTRYEDGSKPEKISWACSESMQSKKCCGVECCLVHHEQDYCNTSGILLIITIIVGILLAICTIGSCIALWSSCNDKGEEEEGQQELQSIQVRSWR